MLKDTFRLWPPEGAFDALLAWIAAVTATVLAMSLPNPGEPGTVPLIAIVGLSAATAIGYLGGKRGPSLRATGFAGAYAGSAVGLLLYVFGLATGIY
ncbi:MAG: hypothetical protein WD649_01230 [Thermoleophilaceae bacterium]